MNTARHSFSRFLSFSILSLFLLTYPQTLFAQTAVINPPLKHDGLEFEEPLAFSDDSLASLSLSFGIQEALSVKAHAEKRVLAESVVSPTPHSTERPLQSLPSSLITPTPSKNTPSPLRQPTTVPSITPTPTAIPTEEIALTTSSGGLSAEKLFAMSNAYRAERGLPPFEKDEKSCQLARERAPEVAGEVASGALHSGLYARNLPYWNTENIISMSTEEEAFTWWINDPIHQKAIVGDFTYSCAACSGNSCAQEFTNYQPK